MDDKFKGQREMSAVVSESVFRQAFDGNLEELQGMVTEKCPSTLICSAEEVNKGCLLYTSSAGRQKKSKENIL